MPKSYVLRNIDPDLWRRVKSLAARKDITIRKLITDVLWKVVISNHA